MPKKFIERQIGRYVLKKTPKRVTQRVRDVFSRTKTRKKPKVRRQQAPEHVLGKRYDITRDPFYTLPIDFVNRLDKPSKAQRVFNKVVRDTSIAVGGSIVGGSIVKRIYKKREKKSNRRRKRR